MRSSMYLSSATLESAERVVRRWCCLPEYVCIQFARVFRHTAAALLSSLLLWQAKRLRLIVATNISCPVCHVSEGVVVGVMEEGRRPYVATIPPEESTGMGSSGGGMSTASVMPMDPRIPRIRIKTRQLAQV